MSCFEFLKSAWIIVFRVLFSEGSIETEFLLCEVDKTIKQCLQKTSQDHSRCIKAMEELWDFHISRVMLRQYPQIVATMKQVSNFIFLES